MTDLQMVKIPQLCPEIVKKDQKR